MGNLLKNNFLSLLVCLCALGALSFADTYVRPYGAVNYAAGTRAIGSVVNAEFDSLKNWLNGGNISSENIAALGIATSNIADDAVTPAKMARLTPTSMSTTLPVSLGTGCPAAVSGSLSITTTGRPVYLNFRSSGSSSGFIMATSLETVIQGNAIGAQVVIKRNGSTVFQFEPQVSATEVPAAPGNWEWVIPSTSFNVVDNPSEGLNVYTVEISGFGDGVCGSVFVGFQDTLLTAYEL